ncbi:sensor histidine kinase [Pseudobacteroides cellulosolvens]|uniref:histidine kinase n=1 Tax=Pseudobacteroides cellulosolvens ATCC 35603 = DSM 2933 TaxID=398512 RepID=A0A0L6JQZ9_9FIRM|nr:ATP-binding protein [Pseudobacteroides cellulosolvens]KNY27802.1 integral membrane sensor signal transduction histidine kinase [Pseudobacteroides cellulosolvens ATCC 35603 = DSM 2933]
MFRKLKIKFIMTNVVSLSVVLLIIFSGIYFSMKYFMKFQADIILNTIARDEQLSSDYNPSLVRFFFIKVDPSGKTIGFDSDINIAENDIETLKDMAFKSNITNGNVTKNNLKFKFIIVPKEYGSILVFLDYSVEVEMTKPLLFISAFICLITLTLVFIISIFLANKSIQPIKKSWEKQAAFIADASHELRTPLAVVTSNLEIVMENETETVGSQKKWFGNIHSELERMKKLVDDLLFLARADAEDEIPKDYFDLSRLLFKIYDSFIPLAKKKDLSLILDNKDNITLYGNEFQIKQLVTILLDNAIKYTDYGGKIELKLEVSASVYRLSIKDTGEGIPKEHIDKIFDRFYRVDKSRSRTYGGSGLGLAIAKCIINEHKGTINIISEVDKGTEVVIFFPVGLSK